MSKNAKYHRELVKVENYIAKLHELIDICIPPTNTPDEVTDEPMTSKEFKAWRIPMGWTLDEAAYQLGKARSAVALYDNVGDTRISHTVKLACAALKAGIGVKPPLPVKKLGRPPGLKNRISHT